MSLRLAIKNTCDFKPVWLHLIYFLVFSFRHSCLTYQFVKTEFLLIIYNTSYPSSTSSDYTRKVVVSNIVKKITIQRHRLKLFMIILSKRTTLFLICCCLYRTVHFSKFRDFNFRIHYVEVTFLSFLQILNFDFHIFRRKS